MIILGIGANLTNPDFGSPRANCGAALQKLENLNVSVEFRSSWYQSQPIPFPSQQPWYVNAVVAVSTSLAPLALMECLLQVELEIGRRRTSPNGPRTLDLDILAYHDTVIDDPTNNHLKLQLPHPRMHLRAFVIIPLCDFLPNWIHPILGYSAEQLLNQIPADQKIRRMIDADGLFGTEWRSET